MQENGKVSDPVSVSSGISGLDQLIHGFHLGDNVVWQVETLAQYRHFANALLDQAVRDQRTFVYIRFGTHEPVLGPGPGLAIESFDPRAGFDVFSAQVNRIISNWGERVFYVFDNLSCLVDLWATDELLTNFFQATCPYLFELDTVAYFALDRGRHADEAVTRIRDTTQVLLDTFQINNALHVRPLKVWQRHSPHMFLPHRVEREAWIPVPQSEVPPTVLAHETTAPWDAVYAELKVLYSLDRAGREEERVEALQELLTRMLLGNDEKILRLAEEHLTLAVLMHVRRRVVGSGRIGGKAAGMLLARAIVRNTCKDVSPAFPLLDEDSFHIGSDVFYTFLVHNDLFRMRLSATRAGEVSREEFEEVEARFLKGSFDEARIREFRALLEEVGESPIIVRSSSLLEDGFGNAFAGKYRSEFCVNRGSMEARLESFMRAIKLVYASTLNPDALSYRRNRAMLENDEQMAILVQRVSGTSHGRYFLPTLAGVAFSRNLYAWTDRIDPRVGMIRLVFGLGTRAVNRVSRDYPRMIAVSHPELRPEIGEEVTTYSQRHVDVLDMDGGGFRTVRMSEILKEGRYPVLHLLVSTRQDGYLTEPVGRRVDHAADVVLTFNRLLKETPFVRMVGRMLSALEAVYEQPVDTEFTASVALNGHVEINILQCRPMWLPGATDHVDFPEEIESDQLLYRTDRFINGGVVDPIRFMLYIDPKAYSLLGDEGIRKSLPRVVGQINRDPRIKGGRIMMMGPGRWGSGNPELGVGVGYADIDQVSVLVEVAYEEDGHVPEVSYGTHFFQDLVEAEIIYIALYPGRADTDFNEYFFGSAPNNLTDFFPELEPYAGIVHLIDVPGCRGGRHVRLVADPDSRRAVCYLE